MIARMDWTGCRLKVVGSKSPSMVGLEGIVILETQRSWRIITVSSQQKIILKEPAKVEVCLSTEGRRFVVLGAHLMESPEWRGKSKLKPRKQMFL
eukprot:Trichotokara_eunicae@DN642_c0_g1_i2.p1